MLSIPRIFPPPRWKDPFHFPTPARLTRRGLRGGLAFAGLPG